MRAAPSRNAITPPSNAAKSRSRPIGIVHLTPKKVVPTGDRFCKTNISTRISSSMLNPSAHQATPVRVLGTIDCAGIPIGVEDSGRAGRVTSNGWGGALGSVSGGGGPPSAWLTREVIPPRDALRKGREQSVVVQFGLALPEVETLPQPRLGRARPALSGVPEGADLVVMPTEVVDKRTTSVVQPFI